MLQFITDQPEVQRLFHKEAEEDEIDCAIVWLSNNDPPLALYKKLIGHIINNPNLVIGIDPECPKRSEIETLIGVYQDAKPIASTKQQLKVDFRIWMLRYGSRKPKHSHL